MKAWKRARSDLQLYFIEVKARDKLREEFLVLSDVFDMLLDLFRVHCNVESGQSKVRSKAELTKIKFNIMDTVCLKLKEVRMMINGSLARRKVNDEFLNLNRYKHFYTIFDHKK